MCSYVILCPKHNPNAASVGCMNLQLVGDCLDESEQICRRNSTSQIVANLMHSWVVSTVCIEFATNSWQIWLKNWKLNMSRIYPVKLAAEFETGSRLPTGDYTPLDTTRLSMEVFNFFTKSIGDRREQCWVVTSYSNVRYCN